MPRHRAAVVEPPRPEVQQHVAKRHPAPPACEPTDETGLSDAQKDVLFQQFEAWQAQGGKDEGGEARPDAPAPPRARHASAAACRSRTP
jgi:hypothetical protein